MTTSNWKVSVYPETKGKKAYVLPGAFYGQCVLLMAEAGYSKAETIEDADVVVFIGGEDINPSLYGQANASSWFSDARDAVEVEAYKKAQELGKVCFGICRGAQFLHAMNGGILWQDVNNHAGKNHDIIDLEDDVTVSVTSMHHQMLQVNDRLDLIAVTAVPVATRFSDDTTDVRQALDADLADEDFIQEVEAGAYHDTKCFFVQGHPEVGSVYYRTWTMHKLFDLMNEWGSMDRVKEIINVKVSN